MRTAFIDQLTVEARTNDKIFLLVGDLGFSVVEKFSEEFPDRFLNVGVAEQNMAGVAAGLALEGYCVYIYSIGNFPTLRCIEQIRYDICYHNLNVKIVAVGGGFTYGPLGPSHHATEEIGMLRAVPNLVVCAPGDPIETRLIVSFTAAYSGPCYIRLGKAGEPRVHDRALEKIMLGEVLSIATGEETCVLSTGGILKYVCDFRYETNKNFSIYSFPFIKPINNDQIVKILQRYKKIITIEEHQAQTGFGSAILEKIHDLFEQELIYEIPKIRRIAIPDKFYSLAGSQEYLRQQAGLDLAKVI